MKTEIELQVAREGERTLLRCPGVGIFTCAVPAGRVLVGGEQAGVLTTLGVSRALTVPKGARGRIASPIPERVHEPVEYGQVLYELEAIGDADALVDEEQDAAEGADGLVLKSSQTGRFWRSPGPGEPSFAEVGDVLEPGTPVGLVEVMKTFTHVTYQSEGDLPERGKIVAFLSDDGTEVSPGTPLIRVEPA